MCVLVLDGCAAEPDWMLRLDHESERNHEHGHKESHTKLNFCWNLAQSMLSIVLVAVVNARNKMEVCKNSRKCLTTKAANPSWLHIEIRTSSWIFHVWLLQKPRGVTTTSFNGNRERRPVSCIFDLLVYNSVKAPYSNYSNWKSYRDKLWE